MLWKKVGENMHEMKGNVKPFAIMIEVYLLCYLVRIVDYFVIRTDQTVIGEAFIHKLFGIFVLLIILKKIKWRLSDIGLVKEGAARQLSIGLVFGLSMFAIGYGIEVLISIIKGNFSTVSFYVSSYVVD